MIDPSLYSLKNLILLSVLIVFVAVLVILARLERLHNSLREDIQGNAEELKRRATFLRETKERLKKRKHELMGREEQQILDEIKKISNLWKSRRERLEKGFWKKIEEESNELKNLQEERAKVEELIRNTKSKYHKREIDEESFREIVKDYQKELMEITLKIDRLGGRNPGMERRDGRRDERGV